MLKHRDLHETTELYHLLRHPEVFPFVRQKPASAEEYLFMTKQLMEEEQQGLTVSRTIVGDYGQPIGTISIFDVADGAGFLGTWIGKQYQGKGYNQKAKYDFLCELFFELDFHTVFLRIRTQNTRSQAAAMKLPYVIDAAETHPQLLAEINAGEVQYNLYKIPRDLFYLVTKKAQEDEEEQAM